MAPKLRVEYPVANYHVINRDDRRQPIVPDEAENLAVAADKEQKS